MWLVVNPGTIASGAKVTFAGETAGYTFSKEVILSNDLMFPESQLAVINLNLADEHCTKKAMANNFVLHEAELVEGDYLVVYEGKAMKAEVANGRLAYADVKVSEKTIANSDASIVWHLSPSGDYWTILNEKTSKYAASTGAKNKAQLLADGADDKSLWTVTKTKNAATFEFVNKANSSANPAVNANLRNNGTNGFACYSASTGGPLSLYRLGGPVDNTVPTLSVDQTSKTWAADATDAFVVKVTVNSEGGDWTVTPETLSWATIAVDKAAGTITVTPNRANETETANEAKLTVAHASDASLTKEITLTQKAAGGIDYSKVYTSNVKTLNKKVKIGEVEYDAVQVGTGSKSGSFSFNVPVGTTKLHLHVVGWKGEGGKIHTIATSVGTISSTSITTVADTGATSSSPFTLSKTDYSGKDYYFEFTLTNITKESTITISNSAGNSRGVYFGINAE